MGNELYQNQAYNNSAMKLVYNLHILFEIYKTHKQCANYNDVIGEINVK